MSIKTDYAKEYKRVMSLFRSLEKRGYDIELSRPTKVKRPTEASIRGLKGYTPERLYERSTYTLSTGETISGKIRRGMIRRAGGKKAALTRKAREKGGIEVTPVLPDEGEITIDWIYREIEQWTPQANWSESLTEFKRGDKNKLKNILDESINRYGKNQVLGKIKENATRINEIVMAALYGSGDGGKRGLDFNNYRDQIDFDLVQFAEILKGEPLDKDEILSFTELMEMQEFL